MKQILFLTLLLPILNGCQSSVDLNDIDFEKISVPFTNNEIIATEETFNLNSESHFRIDSSIAVLSNSRNIHGVIYDSLGNVVNADICFAYFPNELDNRIAEGKSLIVSKQEYKDSTLQFYAKHIIDLKSLKRLKDSGLELKKTNILIFWNMSLVQAFEKSGIINFIKKYKDNKDIQIIFVNSDNNPEWNISKEELNQRISVFNKIEKK